MGQPARVSVLVLVLVRVLVLVLVLVQRCIVALLETLARLHAR